MTIKSRRAMFLTLLLLCYCSTKPLWAVVIDPGHGGDDSGVVGCGNLTEATLAMAFAQRLRQHAPGKVLLTRPNSSDMTWEARVAVANAALAKSGGGDIFISLHADSAPTPATQGMRLYLLTPNLRQAGQKQLTTPAPQLQTVADIALQHAAASDELATEIEIALRQIFPTLTIKRQRGSFLPLTGVQAPAVMLGLGFLSNLADCQRLTQNQSLDQLAKAVGLGIATYFKRQK